MNLRLIKASPLLLAVALLSACGDRGGSSDTRVNMAPTISTIPDQMIQANGLSELINLTLVDDMPSDGLSLSAEADDPNLIGDLILSSNAGPTLRISPVEGQIGTTNITVTVTDSDGETDSTAFQVIVVEQMITVSNLVPLVFADDANANPRDLNSRILVQDSDGVDFFQSLNL